MAAACSLALPLPTKRGPGATRVRELHLCGREGRGRPEGRSPSARAQRAVGPRLRAPAEDSDEPRPGSPRVPLGTSFFLLFSKEERGLGC